MLNLKISRLKKVLFNIINFIVLKFVKNDFIKKNIFFEKNKNISIPLIYLPLNESMLDLLLIRKKCLIHKLNDPFKRISFSNITIPSLLLAKNYEKYTYIKHKLSIKLLICHYQKLKKTNSDLNIKLVIVHLIFSRNPKSCMIKRDSSFLNFINEIKKIFFLIFLQNSGFMHISTPVSLNDIYNKYKNDISFKKKVFRFLQIKTIRNYIVSNNCDFLLKKKLVRKIIFSRNLRKNSILNKKFKKNISKLITEVHSNMSYIYIKIFNKILMYLFKFMYEKIYVSNIDNVKNLAMMRHKIFYIPCHRSHIDYIIISYVIYNYGLSVPYIAAGINLNIWPIGFILKNLGAFFIRRTFKHKFYLNFIKEYFKEIFKVNTPIEYFIEGQRSRHGRLLSPKTGMLTMTIRSLLGNNINKVIVFVPIYINYENVVEIESYIHEIHKIKINIKKSKHRNLKKNFNFGICHINFGNPIVISELFVKNKIKSDYNLTKFTDDIAKEIMVRINNSAVVNIITLYTTILLYSKNYSANLNKLFNYVKIYINTLKTLTYSSNIILEENLNRKNFIFCLTKSKRLSYKICKTNNIVLFLTPEQKFINTYYFNNIKHLLILPSLIANIICNTMVIRKKNLIYIVKLIYPFFKEDFFLQQKSNLTIDVQNLIITFSKYNLIKIKDKKIYLINENLKLFKIMSNHIKIEIFLYKQIFSVLLNNLNLSDKIELMQKVKYLINIKKDIRKNILDLRYNFFKVLKQENYFYSNEKLKAKKIKETYKIINIISKNNF